MIAKGELVECEPVIPFDTEIFRALVATVKGPAAQWECLVDALDRGLLTRLQFIELLNGNPARSR